MLYCTDVDLLHYEPNLFKDAAFASQTLLTGVGNLAGTSFTITAGSLLTSRVSKDGVICLLGTIVGSYPIVKVDSATQLTLSVLYDGLRPASGDPVAVPVATAVNQPFAVRTFWAQRRVVSDMIAAVAGLDGDSPPLLMNAPALVRPCALGTLQMVYNALAAIVEEPAEPLHRAERYGLWFRQAMAAARIELDTNGDGRGDTTRHLGLCQLVRK